MSVSDFTRFRTLGVKPNRPQATPERQALIRALGQLGNVRADLNQLVKDRQAHTFVKPEDAEAAFKSIALIPDMIHAELDRINKELNGNGD